MPKREREKGKRFERLVAKTLTEHWPWRAERQSQYRGGRQDGVDVVCGPFSVECKHRKVLSPMSALEQAERDAKPATNAIAILRRDGEEPVVIMRLSTLLGAFSPVRTDTGVVVVDD